MELAIFASGVDGIARKCHNAGMRVFLGHRTDCKSGFNRLNLGWLQTERSFGFRGFHYPGNGVDWCNLLVNFSRFTPSCQCLPFQAESLFPLAPIQH